MKIIPTRGLFIILLLSSATLMSQTKVVLINEVPTRVEIADGDITAVNSEVPGYMNGYTKSPQSNFIRAPYQLPKPVAAYAELDSPEIDLSNVPALTDTNETDDSEISDDMIDELNNSLFFDYGSAILSEENIKNLDGFAEKLKSRSAKTILLKSWFRGGDDESHTVVKNRLDACKQYLETKGVASNIILTSQIGSNRESRFVTVVLN